MTDYFKYPLAGISVCFSAGVLVGSLIRVPTGWMLISFFSVLLLIGYFLPKHKMILLLALFFFLSGSIRFRIWYQNQLEHPLVNFFPMNGVTIQGCLEGTPVNRRGVTCTESLFYYGQKLNIHRNFQFRSALDLPALEPGDRIRLENVQIRSVPGPLNPGQFDYHRFTAFQGLMGEIEPGPDTRIVIHKVKGTFNVQRILFRIRTSIDEIIHRHLTGEAAGFISAILLGNRGELPDEIRADFRNTGVAHILAISGLHVGFVVYLVHLLLSFFPISFRWQNGLTVLFLFFYMGLTGGNPPVVRATLMISLYLIGNNLERKPHPFNTVGAAALLLLIIQPRQLFWVGFQFSFAAVLSILIFYEKLSRLPLQFLAGWQIHPAVTRILKYFVSLFLVSVAAQIGTLPLVGWYFQQIPVISLLLNLIVIPGIALVIPTGVILIAVSVFSDLLALLAGKFLSSVIFILFKVVHFFAGVPFAYFEIPAAGALEILIYFMAVFLVTNCFFGRFRFLRRLILVILILSILLSLRPEIHRPRIVMLDVGQGDAFLVSTAGGKKVLIDCGEANRYWDTGKDVIKPFLKYNGSLHLDKVIITHPHSDHLAGLFSLVESVSIDSLYFPDVRISYLWQDSLKKVARHYQIPFRFVQAGDLIVVDRTSKIYVLSPFPDLLCCGEPSGKNINNVSILSLFRISDSVVLFTGDAEREVEEGVGVWGTLLKADILKVGHHGSITSSSPAFLAAVSPKLALISVGRENKFDHPSPQVIERLKYLGATCYRTDQEGAFWLQLNNGTWEIVDWH